MNFDKLIKMGEAKKTALILLLFISLVYSYGINTKDEIQGELKENTVDKHLVKNIRFTKTHKAGVRVNKDRGVKLNDEKTGRILWPYPLDPSDHNKENATKVTVNNTENKNSSKRGRLLLWSYPQSPIVNVMMQSLANNYVPQNPNDPFDFLRDTYPLPKGFSAPLDEYDYIIVGAGSAGSVLASRLTEDKPRATVLVIEAGKPEMLLTDVPALVPYFSLSDYAFPYSAEHQLGVCLGSEEQRCYWPRGKAVGGTSVINYMLYTRGRPEDWDQIATDGNYGWSYNEILPYYKKSERAELKRSNKKASHRGRDGELTVENVPFRTGLVEAFLAAGRNLGHPTVDYNSPDQLGFGYIQTTTEKGHRLSAAKAFLHPHKRRRNLHILTESRATKVIVEPQTKRAYAVEYVRNGKKHVVRCRREVILSAGPIASPQLLMLSGIGPQKQLQTLGIPVIKDLPVGQKLYDHICFPGVIFRLNTTNASLMESKIATLPNAMQWLQYGEGLLTTPGGVEAIGYIKTSVSEEVGQVPDIELISLGTSINVDNGGIFRQSWKLTDKLYRTTFGSLDNVDTWSAVPMLLKPRSKGYMELRDTNPFSHPKLYGNYLTDPKDMATLKEAIKYVIKLGSSESFAKYSPKLHLGPYHTCMTLTPGSDEYWDCAIRTLAVSLHHQIATCKMGPPNDPEAVVDPELRVYGIEGLRVVDSSIIPRPTAAHTNAPAIMIGEKAADLIRTRWANVVA